MSKRVWLQQHNHTLVCLAANTADSWFQVAVLHRIMSRIQGVSHASNTANQYLIKICNHAKTPTTPEDRMCFKGVLHVSVPDCIRTSAAVNLFNTKYY